MDLIQIVNCSLITTILWAVIKETAAAGFAHLVLTTTFSIYMLYRHGDVPPEARKKSIWAVWSLLVAVCVITAATQSVRSYSLFYASVKRNINKGDDDNKIGGDIIKNIVDFLLIAVLTMVVIPFISKILCIFVFGHLKFGTSSYYLLPFFLFLIFIF